MSRKQKFNEEEIFHDVNIFEPLFNKFKLWITSLIIYF